MVFLSNAQSSIKIFTVIEYEMYNREKEESFDQDLDSLLQSLEELQAETEEAQLQDRKGIVPESDSEDDDIEDQSEVSVEAYQQQQMEVIEFVNNNYMDYEMFDNYFSHICALYLSLDFYFILAINN